MRFFSEISLLLLVTVCPLLTLGGLSLRFTIAGEWFLLAGVMSVMFALTTIARVKHRFVEPLKTLTENLYANIETPGRHQPPELRQLLRAIRFYSAAGNVNAMNRVNELELAIRDDISAHNAGNLLLKQERDVLRETKSELIDATKDLEVQKLLARETARKTVALANMNPLDPEAVTELENLQFLLADSHLFPATKTHDLLKLIDRVIDITAPLSRMRNATFQVEFESDCPRFFSLDNGRFGSSFFQLLIGYLQLSDPPQDKKDQIFIKVGQTTKGFTLTFPKASNRKSNTELNESLKSAGATWNHKTLAFPATVIHQKNSAETNLTAIVVSEDEYERSSLTKRLSFLGINCITDFKNQHLDICVASDETSEVFLSIKPYLPEATIVLMLNNRQHYQHQRWITVNDPVTQTQLEKIVTRITSTKSISSQKNVLVVDDSEGNIQLLEIQLKELGHKVTAAATGEVAVSLAKRGQFEMIFMDIQMPGIGGLEATNRIRQHNRSVLIVGLTAHATTEEKKGCLAAGMNDVLIKPVGMESLRVITQRLGQADGFPPLAASGAMALPTFDLDLALKNAGDRRGLATELFDLLLASLPSDLDAINAASSNINDLKRAVHKLHGAVRYCGVPRLAKAIQKLELALKHGEELEIQTLLNLLNGEVTALNTWHHDNPDVLSSGDQQIKHR
jgi:CheY-like chemotaxis protein